MISFVLITHQENLLAEYLLTFIEKSNYNHIEMFT